MEFIDVEHAGDFLVMAATLMEIKSKMLLPRGEQDAEEDADPRLELVRQLIEYKKFKDAAGLLEAQAERQLSRLPRAQVELAEPVNPAQQPLRQVELWDLVSAFGRLMRETLALQPQQIVVDQTPVHVYMEQIVQHLERAGRLPFSALFTPPYQRSRLVGMFLAVLELVRMRRAAAEQDECFGEIWMSAVA
jgi:segregation and condensation protein A